MSNEILVFKHLLMLTKKAGLVTSRFLLPIGFLRQPCERIESFIKLVLKRFGKMDFCMFEKPFKCTDYVSFLEWSRFQNMRSKLLTPDQSHSIHL